MPSENDWPRDADGDVLRRLVKNGFDFSAAHDVDFNIDFADWPPPAEAIQSLRSRYPIVKIFDDDRYVLVQVRATITYAFVVRIQADLSEQMSPFGGVCESWGVLHGPN